MVKVVAKFDDGSQIVSPYTRIKTADRVAWRIAQTYQGCIIAEVVLADGVVVKTYAPPP